jgi:hypothetical protein
VRRPLFFTLLLATSLAIALANASVARGQAEFKFPVIIQVSDQGGACIVRAKVQIVPPPVPLPAKMDTDDTGNVAVQLPMGEYAVFVSAQGFKTTSQHFEITGITSAADPRQIVPVTLQIANFGGPVAVYPKESLVLKADPYHVPIAYSATQFRSLPHIEIKLHNAHSNVDETYSGVPLATLLAQANVPLGKELRGEPLTSYLLASGTDGYSVLLSLAEVDPNFHAGQVIVADTRDGQPLGDHGPFELIVSDDKRPARWVHNLNSIGLQNGH